MASQLLRRYLLFLVLAAAGMSLNAQKNVPLGIHYQAVARDNYGNELVNRKISVKFSIISGDPMASAIYQELHNDILTSKFGVFSIVIGRGTPSLSMPCTNFSQIGWEQANHFLKVEVKFENDFMDMGTMPFLAVPYALYAQKSLEPGPEGPRGERGEKGEPGRDGDPATDNQTLSFDGSNLTISGTTSTVNLTPLLQTLQVSNDGTGGYNLGLSRGNVINLATIERDGDPQNEIQDLAYNPATRDLTLLKSTAPAINLSELKNDADADPANEMQDLTLTGDVLSISKLSGARQVNLGVYRDNTDNQQLSYSEATHSLSVSGGNNVTLGTLTAFRAKKTATTTGLAMSNVDFIPDNVEYNDGNGFNTNTGEFTAAYTGIYTFDVKYVSGGDGKSVYIYKNGNLYETLATGLSSGTVIYRTLTIKILASDKIKLVIFTGTDPNIGTGTFSGYKVY